MLPQWRSTPASLSPSLHRLAGSSSTWGDVGAVLEGRVPAGCTWLEQRTVLPPGRASYEKVSGALMAWRLHREARMIQAVSAERVDVGVRVVNAAPFGPLSVLAPCEVVSVLDEADRSGFVYASLPGHPLAGEEQLSVEWEDGRAVFWIRSVSRPTGVGRLAPPLVHAGQRLINRRYAAAARRLAR